MESHLSPHILVVCPFLILQNMSSRIIGIEFTKLLHKKDGLVTSLASKMLLLEKYLARVFERPGNLDLIRLSKLA